MKSPLCSKRAIHIFVVTMLLLVASTSVAFADNGTPITHQDTTSESFIIRQGDPVIYKEIAIPSGKSLDPLSPTALYRAGWTDAYWDMLIFPFFTINHHGSHNSQSDLVENQIWVDGNLEVNGNNVDSCSNHKSGQFAGCITTKIDQWKYSITATSWHFFHTPGYVDSNFSTAKTVNPW
jgi:hypothetical protein